MKPGYYNDMFGMLRELTIRAVDSVPADKMAYQPEHSRSFGEIALHLAEVSDRILHGVKGEEHKPEREVTRANYPTKDAILALLRAGKQQAHDLLSTLPAAALETIVKTPMGTDGPAEMWLSILLLHESDHKGNLVIMAKTLGCNPPDVVALRREMAAR